MSIALDDLLDIDETDPLRIVVAIDKKIRPQFGDGESQISNANEVEAVVNYFETISHACRIFGIRFTVDPPERDTFEAARKLWFETRTFMDKKKIDVLHARVAKESSVTIDESWRTKIHSYLASIRAIVEREEMDVGIRERILTSLNDLAQDVDRYRAPMQKFTDTLVAICAGISSGATALTPAVKLLERVIGAIERLKGSTPKPLQLPKPEDLGLPDDTGVPQLPSPEIETGEALRDGS